MPGDAKIDDIDNDGDKDIIAVIYDTSVLKPPPSTNKLKYGSTWEQVNVPGFGNINNMSVVAMAEYQGHLYALTRNQAQGCEVWRTTAPADGSRCFSGWSYQWSVRQSKYQQCLGKDDCV